MAFLQVLTRVYRRPRLLWSNIRSLEAQTDSDWQQTFLLDGEGRGVGAAQAALANFAPYVSGEMIMVIDDDDRLVCPTLVHDLRTIVTEHDPDIVIVRMNHGDGRILPDDDHWQRAPQLSFIGVSAAIVKRRIFQRHATAFNSAHYASDYDYLSSLFSADHEIYWHYCVATEIQRLSLGRPE